MSEVWWWMYHLYVLQTRRWNTELALQGDIKIFRRSMLTNKYSLLNILDYFLEFTVTARAYGLVWFR